MGIEVRPSEGSNHAGWEMVTTYEKTNAAYSSGRLRRKIRCVMKIGISRWPSIFTSGCGIKGYARQFLLLELLDVAHVVLYRQAEKALEIELTLQTWISMTRRELQQALQL